MNSENKEQTENTTQTPLKNRSDEELKDGYVKVARWTILRENAKTKKAQKEYQLGLRRVEEFEDEMTSRGMNIGELYAMYLNSVDIIADAEEITSY